MISLENMVQFGQFTDGAYKFEKDFSVSYTADKATGCTILNSMASYIGENAPKIRFTLTADGQETPFYESHRYRMGRKNEFTRQGWRVPPLFLEKIVLTVDIRIPQGTVLFIKNFETAPDVGARDFSCGLRHNAHLGFWGLAPINTMPAFELAAECHYRTCIVVPKVTLDGVLVCIHDDTINATARDANGNPPSEPIYVWDKTYEELLEWDYGTHKNVIYKGTKLPLLSDFFNLCVKTGMKPMFSTHPGLTVEQWKQVREMLECRGLLSSFHIKSFRIEILKTAYSVFGTDIDGYTYDVKTAEEVHIDELNSIGIDISSCRAGIEVPFDKCTEEIVKKIKEAGYFPSVWNITWRDFEEYERVISWGVNEFTEDLHCSMGLNY